MSLNGHFYGKTSNSAIKPQITWEAVANEQGNYSDVTATLSYSRKDGYTTSGHWAGSITIDGDSKSRSGHYMVITKDSNTLAITHTVRVPHHDNGSRTIVISASGSISETTLTKTVISAEVTLENIPRAASIAASDGDIGSTVMVNIGKKSDAYRYQVAYTFGNLTGFLTEDGLSEQSAYTQAACLAFPLPESFYGQMPEATTQLCHLTCTTYLEDTQISTPQQASFSVRANPDRCGPLVAGTVTDINPQTLALTGDAARQIRGASTALCLLEAQARGEATLVQKRIADTVLIEDSLQIPAFDQETLRFWVKDSRGYTAKAEIEVPLIPYFPPVARLEASRKDAVSGDGQLIARGTFYNGSFGAQSNHLLLRWRLNDGDWQTMEPTLEGNSFTAEATVSGMDYTRAHRITLEVSDALQQVTAGADIQPGIPVFDWGREDFAFHVPVTVQDVEILKELLQLKENSLRRTGDAMAGPLNMGNQSLTGLPQPIENTDAVPKSYADRKLEIRKLWENNNPDISFAPQTIDLDLTDADGVSVFYKNESTGTLFLNTGYIPKDRRGSLWYAYQSGNQCYRAFQATDSGVEFYEGAYSASSGARNIMAIPVEIYGWYGVMDLAAESEISAVCGAFVCGSAVCGR